MRHPRLLGVLFAALVAARLGAQATPQWEMLLEAPLPDDAEPKISVIHLPVAPAPAVPTGRGFPSHQHAGPVFGYILEGNIENQVEPDPVQIYKPGGYFAEPTMHVHKLLRNLSQTEPAKIIVFEAGSIGKAANPIRTLLQETLPTTKDQDLHLLRLALPAGSAAESHPHTGPAIVYVAAGEIETSGATHRAGELFVEHANPVGVTIRNAGAEAATILLYEVTSR